MRRPMDMFKKFVLPAVVIVSTIFGGQGETKGDAPKESVSSFKKTGEKNKKETKPKKERLQKIDLGGVKQEIETLGADSKKLPSLKVRENSAEKISENNYDLVKKSLVDKNRPTVLEKREVIRDLKKMNGEALGLLVDKAWLTYETEIDDKEREIGIGLVSDRPDRERALVLIQSKNGVNTIIPEGGAAKFIGTIIINEINRENMPIVKTLADAVRSVQDLIQGGASDNKIRESLQKNFPDVPLNTKTGTRPMAQE